MRIRHNTHECSKRDSFRGEFEKIRYLDNAVPRSSASVEIRTIGPKPPERRLQPRMTAPQSTGLIEGVAYEFDDVAVGVRYVDLGPAGYGAGAKDHFARIALRRA